MSSGISYTEISKDSSIPFDKISKIFPDHERKRLDQSEDTEQCLNKRNTVKTLLEPKHHLYHRINQHITRERQIYKIRRLIIKRIRKSRRY